jgi:hypothetical protein
MAMARGPHVLLGEELHVADLKAHRPDERETAFFSTSWPTWLTL